MRHALPALLVLALAACARPPGVEGPVERIFVGATVHTLDPAQPAAEAVAVTAGRIVAAGTREEMLALTGERTELVELEGAHLYPGFTDAHMHLQGVGARELELNLEGTPGLAAFVARIAAEAERVKPGQWIVGRGWIETHWQPPAFPTRADLDRAAPDNPVMLWRADGHAAVANSKALALADIDRKTADPFGGAILRDARGEATGMLIDNAQALVTRHIPADAGVALERALAEGVARSVRLGWTGLQDAGVDWATVERMRALCAQDALPLRWYAALDAPSGDAEALLARGPIVGECDGRVTVRALKFYADGALGSRGAALLEQYADAEGTGLMRNTAETLAPLYARALRAGIQVETHAIGDRGNRFVLDLYQRAFAKVPAGERRVEAPRWRIEHAQVLAPEDLSRFAALGVIPSMQPSHAISDLHFAPSRLGPARLAGAYAWRTLIDSGVVIPAGSDAPVEQGDPRIEFYAAVARRDMQGFQGEGWHPELAMTREEALKALTLWPAIAAFEEEERGSIVTGKRADFTVLDRDLLTVPEAEILGAEVVATVVGGEIVHRAARR